MEKQFMLELSNEDFKKFYMLASTAGLTTEQLLESFIGDLICGEHTNGSDERMLAEDWFHRCEFSHYPKKTFVKFLLEKDLDSDFLNLLYDKEDIGEQLLKYNDPPEVKSSLRKELLEVSQKLQDIYHKYSIWAGMEAVSYEQAVNDILDWHENLNFQIEPEEDIDLEL